MGVILALVMCFVSAGLCADAVRVENYAMAIFFANFWLLSLALLAVDLIVDEIRKK